MQDLPNSFQGLIDLWPSQRAFGRDVLGAPEQGRVVRRRNRIPRKFWPALKIAARALGLVLTDDYLRQLYDAGRKQGR